jgi:hypothetical protein
MSNERKHTSWSVEGYRRRLQAAINASNDGATIELDLTSAKNINEILKQFVRFKQNMEPGHERA